MTLKFKRPTLLREVTISWWGVVLGFVTIFIGTTAIWLPNLATA